jgi:hypothetical protein
MRPLDAADLLGVAAAVRAAVLPSASEAARDRAMARARRHQEALAGRYAPHARVVRRARELVDKAALALSLAGDRREDASAAAERGAEAVEAEVRSSSAVTAAV